jgi:hypothetical protein
MVSVPKNTDELRDVFKGDFGRSSRNTPEKTLKKGLRDTSGKGPVSEVQTLLRKHGYTLPGGVDGDFGEDTEKAVREFQKNNGLPESGEVDEATLKLLRSSTAKRRTSSAEQSGVPSSVGVSQSGEYTLPKVSFISVPCKSAANLAIKESKEQWDNGNISEKDPRAEAPIQKYYAYTSKHNGWKNNIDRWGTGIRGPGSPHEGKRQLDPVKERNQKGVATNWHHWSAVYVSWVMKQYDGEGAIWFASEGHTLYINSFKKRRKEIEANPEDYKGKMYYLWFTKEEMDKYGLKLEPGDVVGRNSHCDIYIGGNQIIGGNTCAKSEYTGNKKVHCSGTSGPQPLKWKPGAGVIKRVRVIGPGADNAMVA